MELITKTVSNIFEKMSILDVRLGSGYVSGVKVNKVTKAFHGNNMGLAIRYLKHVGLFSYFQLIFY